MSSSRNPKELCREEYGRALVGETETQEGRTRVRITMAPVVALAVVDAVAAMAANVLRDLRRVVRRRGRLSALAGA